MIMFKDVIGYENEKEELLQIIDMIKNKDRYVKLGAKMPKGILIDGKPGLGKSLMAKAFINESGLKSFILRRNKPDGDFIKEIEEIFNKAVESSPSIILLDDLDHFPVDDDSQKEYTACQACIDSVSDKDVFVIATANIYYSLPSSLIRPGRFDIRIQLYLPNREDQVKIMQHYISSKKFDKSLNETDAAMLLSETSCANLESLINMATIYAGRQGAASVSMQHLIRAVVKDKIGVDIMILDRKNRCKEYMNTCYHEAGHLVVSEILSKGSVKFVATGISNRLSPRGFCISWDESRTLDDNIITKLGGMAAESLAFGTRSNGSERDIFDAISIIEESFSFDCSSGFSHVGCISSNATIELQRLAEISSRTRLEHYHSKALEILSNNRAFLDDVANDLYNKGYLLYSDINAIKRNDER